VPGIGHSVVTTDPSGCAALAVHDWVLDASTSRTCSRPPFLVAPMAAFPHAPSRTAGPAVTFAVAARTIAESEAAWLFGASNASPAALPGLTNGRLVPVGNDGFRLAGYGIAKGITLSGTLKLAERNGVTLKFQGTLTVGGRLAAHGTLQVNASGVHGTLGGKSVP
jgi:hypothetical protein